MVNWGQLGDHPTKITVFADFTFLPVGIEINIQGCSVGPGHYGLGHSIGGKMEWGLSANKVHQESRLIHRGVVQPALIVFDVESISDTLVAIPEFSVTEGTVAFDDKSYLFVRPRDEWPELFLAIAQELEESESSQSSSSSADSSTDSDSSPQSNPSIA